ncbi:phBC6A51 family helix-turn-helix protein [Bacillus inaquosorum]|uniref:phBC6A51 family helix-turn-helix protein n=1 Tax=Bacillus subtilis group TaxID=653685 RepID=UPI0022821B7A|nr:MULTISPECIES: phBC6A51 family helix-turn-helix protein [Bacillus subtilis group]MCY8386542.1 phBC6A51 family helix-turn-helix protein [Bacillus inaquosorum]MDK1004023.1 phBC6A51 family helix-turn-helix protein [Bacillus subtilis]
MARKLSEKQIAAIEFLAQPNRGGMTYDQIADAVGVTRQTLHNWRNNDDFYEELKRRIKKQSAERMPDIIASIPDHIINDGNAAMLRTYMQWHDMLTERTEVDVKNDGNNIADIKAEIERLRAQRKTEE